MYSYKHFETVGYTVTVGFFKHLQDFVTADLLNSCTSPVLDHVPVQKVS